jgi:glycosyltransferase involved in cell wall biosynthesis
MPLAIRAPAGHFGEVNILEVTCWLPEGGLGGGGTVVCLDNAQALRRLGADVRIFAGDYSGTHERLTAWDDNGGEVHVTRLALNHRDRHTPLWRKHNPGAAAAFGRHLDERRPNVVHFHSLQGLGFHCLREAVNRCIPSAVTLHDHWWVSPLRFLTNMRTGHLASSARLWATLRCRARRRPIRDLERDLQPVTRGDAPLTHSVSSPPPLASLREAIHTVITLRRMLARADLLIAPSSFVVETHRDLGFRGLHLLRHGTPDVVESGRHSPPQGPVRFGFAGGLSLIKGLRRAIRAIRAFHPDEAELWVWGSDEPTHAPDLLDPRVKWCGTVSHDMRLKFHREMDALLALSLCHETCSMTVLEAQSCGVPSIASDIPAHREIIEDGVNGILVPRVPFDPLVAAMRRVVGDVASLRRMGELCPRNASTDEVARHLVQLFERLAKR